MQAASNPITTKDTKGHEEKPWDWSLRDPSCPSWLTDFPNSTANTERCHLQGTSDIMRRLQIARLESPRPAVAIATDSVRALPLPAEPEPPGAKARAHGNSGGRAYAGDSRMSLASSAHTHAAFSG